MSKNQSENGEEVQENQNSSELLKKKNINFTSIISALFGVAFLGIAIGCIITFCWIYLSQFFTNKVGFGLLGILFLFVLFLLSTLIKKKIETEYENKTATLSKSLTKAITKKELIPSVIRELKDTVKPILSSFALYRVLNIVILTIATVLGGIIAIQQNSLLDIQNRIAENQNKLFKSQNNHIILQNNLLELREEVLQLVKWEAY